VESGCLLVRNTREEKRRRRARRERGGVYQTPVCSRVWLVRREEEQRATDKIIKWSTDLRQASHGDDGLLYDSIQ
jgi:hypothetical protein